MPLILQNHSSCTLSLRMSVYRMLISLMIMTSPLFQRAAFLILKLFILTLIHYINLLPHLSQICESLQKPKLKASEFEFLEEYRRVMEPLVKSIDLLQGEENCFLGFILPTLFQIIRTLHFLPHLVYCEPLKNAILSGIPRRFNHILNSKNDSSKSYVFATISLSKFKFK